MTTAYEKEIAAWEAEVAKWKIIVETWKAIAESYQHDLKMPYMPDFAPMGA